MRHDFCPVYMRNGCYCDGNNDEKKELNHSIYDNAGELRRPTSRCHPLNEIYSLENHCNLTQNTSSRSCSPQIFDSISIRASQLWKDLSFIPTLICCRCLIEIVGHPPAVRSCASPFLLEEPPPPPPRCHPELVFTQWHGNEGGGLSALVSKKSGGSREVTSQPHHPRILPKHTRGSFYEIPFC